MRAVLTCHVDFGEMVGVLNSPVYDRKEIVREELGMLLPEGQLDVSEEVPLTELGIDSLDFFEKILYLEDEFGIRIPVADLNDKVTLADILAQVED